MILVIRGFVKGFLYNLNNFKEIISKVGVEYRFVKMVLVY